MIYMKTSYIAHLPLVVLHTAFIRPPCFLVLQKNNNQNANMNIYYIISSSHFIIFPSNLLPAFIRPPCFLFLQKNNKNKNQNANMNIYYKISLTFIIFPSNLLPAFIRPPRFLVLHPALHQCWPLKRGGGVGIRRGSR